jgi:H+/Cl- antiporter ClcA
MRIRWRNVFLLMLAVVVALMAARLQTFIAIFLDSLAHFGPGHSDDERMRGCLAWLVLAILFGILLRALLHRRGR